MRAFTPRTLKINKCPDGEALKERAVRYTDYLLGRKYLKGRNPCLRRSLILYHLLRKSGMDVHICFGVRFNEVQLASQKQKKLEGHAWLLYNGEIFLERNYKTTKSYKVTYIFPEEERRLFA